MIYLMLAWLMITTPGTNELGSNPIEIELIEDKFEFIETKINLTPEQTKNGREQKLSIWMPSQDILTGNWVLVSKPGIITFESVMLAHELLDSL